jgi:phytoene/squalene synthetase
MLKLPLPTGPYGAHLERVSRSFAFCIEQLEEPLRRHVGLGYILCRMADTVEDSSWGSLALQTAAFEEFESFVTNPPEEARVREWASRFPLAIPEGEAALLQDAPRFFADLHQLSPGVKAVLQRTVMSMVRGMKFFCRQDQGAANPQSLAEANQYCFFVAGIVGELLTDLVAEGVPEYRPAERTYTDAFHFGLYLQKINLLKDQLEDAKVGRRLVPDRAEMRASLVLHAERSLRYIQGIPLSARGYRIFCAWSFFLGLVSLPFIDRSWREQKPSKISRQQTFLYLSKVLIKVSNNEALENLYRDNLPALLAEGGAPGTAPLLPVYGEWFSPLYRGKLSPAALPELGLFQAPPPGTSFE